MQTISSTILNYYEYTDIGKVGKHQANALVRNAQSFFTVTSGRKGFWSYSFPKAESILPNPGTRPFSRSIG
jgi:hypothetical protein